MAYQLLQDTIPARSWMRGWVRIGFSAVRMPKKTFSLARTTSPGCLVEGGSDGTIRVVDQSTGRLVYAARNAQSEKQKQLGWRFCFRSFSHVWKTAQIDAQISVFFFNVLRLRRFLATQPQFWACLDPAGRPLRQSLSLSLLGRVSRNCWFSMARRQQVGGSFETNWKPMDFGQRNQKNVSTITLHAHIAL